jgi:hypothetical protein
MILVQKHRQRQRRHASDRGYRQDGDGGTSQQLLMAREDHSRAVMPGSRAGSRAGDRWKGRVESFVMGAR